MPTRPPDYHEGETLTESQQQHLYAAIHLAGYKNLTRWCVAHGMPVSTVSRQINSTGLAGSTAKRMQQLVHEEVTWPST